MARSSARWPVGLFLLLTASLLVTGVWLSARDQASLAEGAEADLTVIKTGQSWKWPESSAFTYKIWVYNAGPDTAIDTVVTDVLPDGMQFVSANQPCSVGGDVVTCTLGHLANQAEVEVWLEVVTPSVSNDLTYVTNTAGVASATPDPSGTNSSSDEIWVQNVTTDLYLDKAGPATVFEDTEYTYSLFVVGDANWTAKDVRLWDHLPADVQFVSADAPCTVVGHQLVLCDIGELTSNESHTYHVTVRAPNCGGPGCPSLSNTAEITSSTEDPDLGDNSDQVGTTVLEQTTDLRTTKSGPVQALPGSDITYTVALTNDGDWAARDVRLHDSPPGGSSFVQIAPAVGCGWTGSELVCDVADVPAHTTSTYQLTFHLPTGQSVLPESVTNGAWSTTSTPDTDTSNNDDDATTTILPTAPTAPRDAGAGPHDPGAAWIWWQNPAWTGGTPVVSCTVTAAPGGASTVTTDCAGYGGGSTALTGLTPGVGYTFTVRATNAVGTGPPSEPTSEVTVVGVPQTAPTEVTASAGNGQATVWWTPPTNTGGTPLTGYTVVPFPSGPSVSVDGDTTSTVVPGLTNGTTYTFRVVASNDHGDGPLSAPSNAVTPLGPPGAPTGVGALAGNASAQVTWTAPASDGGSPILGYRLRVHPDNRDVDVPASPRSATVTGLVNGQTYTFTAAAHSTQGFGPWSNASNPVTPQSLPGPPEDIGASPGDHQATVTWQPPSDDGGFPILDYTATANPGGRTATVVTSPATITGLTNGQSYTFTVRARTAAGTGPAGGPSPAVTPSGLPVAPSPVTATPAVEAVLVTWGAAGDNGSPLTGYEIEQQPGGAVLAVDPSQTSQVVDGLSPSIAYTFRVRASNGNGAGAWSASTTSTTPLPAPAGLTTLPVPKRLLDSRPGSQVGPYSSPWHAAETRTLSVTGGATGIPPGATAVVLNVTAEFPTSPTHLTVWPTGQPMPTASNVNIGPGQAAANLVTIRVGLGGQISIYNNSGAVNVIADATGYYEPDTGSPFVGIQPKRLLDSRPGSQVGPYSSPWGAGQSRTVTVTGGTTTVPANATAVVLNVTGVVPTAGTHLTVWPAGQTMPLASNLNLPSGDVRPNLVVVKVGTNGQIGVYNNSGNMHVVADVVGYFAPSGGAPFTPIQPNRLIDSRPGSQVGPYSSPWHAAQSRPVTVTGGTTGVPASATAVVLNVTGVFPTAGTHLTVWPAGQAMPLASNLNLPGGDVRPNLVVVKVGVGGQIAIYNNSGDVDVVVDVVGYFG